MSDPSTRGLKASRHHPCLAPERCPPAATNQRLLRRTTEMARSAESVQRKGDKGNDLQGTSLQKVTIARMEPTTSVDSVLQLHGISLTALLGHQHPLPERHRQRKRSLGNAGHQQLNSGTRKSWRSTMPRRALASSTPRSLRRCRPCRGTPWSSFCAGLPKLGPRMWRLHCPQRPLSPPWVQMPLVPWCFLRPCRLLRSLPQA